MTLKEFWTKTSPSDKAKLAAQFAKLRGWKSETGYKYLSAVACKSRRASKETIIAVTKVFDNAGIKDPSRAELLAGMLGLDR